MRPLTWSVALTFVLLGVRMQDTRALPRFTTAIQLETTSDPSANVSMGDLDGDGDLDIVLAKGRHDPYVDKVLLNDGKAHFVTADLGSTADRTYTAALADLDGDGDLDVVVSNDAPDRKLLYFNDGKGRFTVSGTWGDPKWSTRNAAIADLNGDGRPDVIAANRPGPSYVCLNDGRGRLVSPCIPIPAESATTIVPGDFDKDGQIDLAVPSRDGGQSHIYFNDGKAGFARTIAFGPSNAAARVGAAADFDGDGTIDLAVGDEAATSLTVYMNDGKGRLTPGFHIADKQRTPYAMTTADLNGDRHPDIVLGYTEGPHSVFINDGSGKRFVEVKFGEKAGAAYGFAIGDINGDGKPDIALARSGAPNVLYLSEK
jgi:FG-GAP-like repeat